MRSTSSCGITMYHSKSAFIVCFANYLNCRYSNFTGAYTELRRSYVETNFNQGVRSSHLAQAALLSSLHAIDAELLHAASTTSIVSKVDAASPWAEKGGGWPQRQDVA